MSIRAHTGFEAPISQYFLYWLLAPWANNKWDWKQSNPQCKSTEVLSLCTWISVEVILLLKNSDLLGSPLIPSKKCFSLLFFYTAPWRFFLSVSLFWMQDFLFAVSAEGMLSLLPLQLVHVHNEHKTVNTSNTHLQEITRRFKIFKKERKVWLLKAVPFSIHYWCISAVSFAQIVGEMKSNAPFALH